MLIKGIANMRKRWLNKDRRGKDESMPDNIIAEVLAAHADQLLNKETNSQDYVNLFPDHEGELTPLLQIAQRIRETLVPVAPSPEFEASLKRELLTAAVKRAEAQKSRNHSPLLQRRGVLIGAAVGSAISVAGIIAALLWRQRGTARA
jgi:hypothetical protein